GLRPSQHAMTSTPRPPGTPGGEGTGVRGDSVPCEFDVVNARRRVPPHPDSLPPEYRGEREPCGASLPIADREGDAIRSRRSPPPATRSTAPSSTTRASARRRPSRNERPGRRHPP